jgi:sporulation protein YlmC with PRC-barrel domain
MPRLALAILVSVGLLSPVQAGTQEQIVRELIGAPVYSTDGQEVGTVEDIALGEDKEFETLVMKTDQTLGFGERTVEVPGSAFIALRGAVVLHLPAASMDALIEYQADKAESN